MAENRDYQALDWVRGEIEETLKQASQALEGYVANPQDDTRLRFCLTYLHQVHGTLQMVEFYGAALLAEEMEQLAAAMVAAKISNMQDALEVLMRAILQLPTYLDRVKVGKRDMPVILLPLLNDLRAARGESLMSEGGLFTPDLKAGEKARQAQDPTEEELASMGEVLRKVRQLYQVALVGLIRGQDETANYQHLAKCFAKLEKLSGRNPMAQLWWVAEAVVEGLLEKVIPSGTSIKMLLGMLDRQLKHCVDNAAGLQQPVPQDLLKNLLYYVAKAENETTRIHEVRAAFKLDEALPDDALVDMERRRMAGPDREAMSSVVTAITEELTRIKEALDLFVRGQKHEVAELEPVKPQLKQVADTLAVLGLGIPRRVLLEQIDLVQSIIDAGDVRDNRLMDVAGALLYVEATLKGIANDGGERSAGEQASDIAPEQIDDANRAVLKESRAAIEQAKEAVIGFITSKWNKANLAPIPELLGSVRGGLNIVGLNKAAGLLSSIVSFIKEQFIDSSEIDFSARWPELDTLADAMTAIDYFIERMDGVNNGDEDVLEIAEKAVASLGYPLSANSASWGVEPMNLKAEPVAKSAAPAVAQPIEVQEETHDLSDFAQPESFSIAPPETITYNEHADEVTAEEPAPMAAPTARVKIPLPQMAEDDLIDDEMKEIFIEEAQEVLETINENFPMWKSNPDDSEARSVLRRAFHTLKGSGRMVKALRIGEMAWAVENMLNRVIDNTVSTSSMVFALIDRSRELVPELIEDFKAHLTETVPPEQLIIDLATRVAKGEHLDVSLLSAPVAAPVVEATPVQEAPQVVAPIPEEIPETAGLEPMLQVELPSTDDPVLLDIFRGEAETHLATIREFLEEAANRVAAFSNNLLRALHTLKGSANMASIEPIAELATPTERLIKECHAQGLMCDFEIHSLLKEFVDLVDQGVVQLMTDPHHHLPETGEFLNRLTDLIDRKLHGKAETAGQSAKRDPQLIQIFLAEGSDLIIEAADILKSWENNPIPGDALENLRRELRMLAKGAENANLPEVAALCTALEDAYEGVTEGMLTPTPDFLTTAHDAHEHLIGMMDRLAAGQAPAPADEIIERLAALQDAAQQALVDAAQQTVSEVDNNAHVPELLSEDMLTEAELMSDEQIEYGGEDGDEEISAEPVHIAPVAAKEERHINLEMSDTVDAELVEIYLEEAADIVDNISNLLQRWIDSPDNLEAVAQLQRDLHTLKGGARMSQIGAIGDLAHQVESVYEGVVDGIFKPNARLNELLHTSHDALAKMVEQLRNGETAQPADHLVVALANFMKAPQEVAVAPEDMEASMLAAPAAVIEAAQREDAVEGDILSIFLEEAAELLEGLDNAIAAWQGEPNNKAHVQELQRLLHTLKGGARLAGLTKLGNLSHNFETFLIEADEQGRAVTPDFLIQVQQMQDDVVRLVDQVRGVPTAAPAKPAAAAETAAEKPIEAKVVPITAGAPAAKPTWAQDKKPEPAMPKAPQESIKVEAQLLESLVNLAGESSIQRGRIQQMVSDFGFIIEEIGQTVSRVREQLRRLEIEAEATVLYRQQTQLEQSQGGEIEFDPLEMDRYSTLNQLTRSMAESASDLIDLKDSLRERVRDTESLLEQQARVNSELQEGLMRTRMVSFSRVVPRLRRIVRQVASELGKQADLEVVNAEGELDRTVLERMVAPLEHMLRNAVDHGIEMPDERVKSRKNPTGRITLHLTREGSEVVLRLSDDGKGVNVPRVREQAIKQGLMAPEAQLTDNEVMQFLFRTGFSTAEKVTQISGRGVGMDVVYSEIKMLGGTVKIHSAPNVGSQFTVRLPFTVAVNRALMVKVGDDAYAIPLNHIEGIVRVSPYELETYYQPDAPAFEYAGQTYNLRYLGGFVHNNPAPKLQGITKPLPVLLVRGTEHTVALQVDSLVGSREVVVKALGPQLAKVSGLSGATILGDGSVVIILDLVALIRADFAQQLDQRARMVDSQPKQERVTTVMVVDDSVTVRKVTSRLLERQGYEVITAKDGVDAITQLQDVVPDIMLLDIEMPRMDGFEVATQVRHDPRLAHVPIIMITSRTGEKHRDRAFSIGVNRYMGKPFQETELLRSLSELLKQVKSA